MTNCLKNLKTRYNIVAEINCNELDPLELAQQIKLAYREEFLENQRIVLHYSTGSKHTQQNIQTALNVVDISNFFVIIVTPQDKQDVISTDKVPVTFIQTDDRFTLVNDNSRPLSKEDILRAGDSLAIKNTKHFCMAPWVHMYVGTTGKAMLCCASTESFGTVHKNTIKELFTGPYIESVRNDMKKDLSIKGCERCYNEEKLGRSSSRNAYNQKYAKHYKRVEHNSPTLLHWDFRFNNLCNLSCRSCGPWASTTWYKPAKTLGISTKQFVFNDTKVYNELLEYIDVVEEIYFAGGEPLIMPEHYDLLDRLISLGRTNVRLVYNTNLTEINFKGISVFDLWNQFDSVAVCASLDASNNRAEYLRCGTKWDRIEENRIAMQQACPNIYFWVSATTGLINALHVSDFHREWADKGLIRAEDFNIQNIYSPEYMRVDRATLQLKELIVNKYTKHLKWLEPIDTLGRATQGYKSVISYLENLKGFDKDLFWDNIKPLDEYYGVDLLDVFPELDILPKP